MLYQCCRNRSACSLVKLYDLNADSKDSADIDPVGRYLCPLNLFHAANTRCQYTGITRDYLLLGLTYRFFLSF